MDRGARRGVFRGARVGPRRHAVQGEELHLRADRQPDRLRPGQARRDHRAQGNARSRQAAADDRGRQRRPATDRRRARPLLQPRKLRHLAGRERADGRLRQHLPELHAVQPAGIRGLVLPPLGLRRGVGVERSAGCAAAPALARRCRQLVAGGLAPALPGGARQPGGAGRAHRRADGHDQRRQHGARSWAATTIWSGRSSAGGPTSTTFPATSKERPKRFGCGRRNTRASRATPAARSRNTRPRTIARCRIGCTCRGSRHPEA